VQKGVVEPAHSQVSRILIEKSKDPFTGRLKIGRHEGHPMDRFEHIAKLQKEWTDQFVTVNPEQPELKRFAGIMGRVAAVNYSGRAVIDFQDGGWYDIAASTAYLNKVDAAEGKAKYKNVNSAQPIPEKQG
jgi:hypothetical protein